MGVGACLLRRERSVGEAKIMISMTLDLLIILVPLQFLLGDMHGLNTREYQPAKLAAIEGRYDTAAPAPLTLFGIPDDAAETMRLRDRRAVSRQPHAHPQPRRQDRRAQGLSCRQTVRRSRCRSSASASWWGSASSCWRSSSPGRSCGAAGGATARAGSSWLCQAAAPLGFVAVIAGWMTTEVGRQPWTVYGLLRTADSVSPSLTGTDVAISLALYVVVYLIMFPTGIAFMATIVRRGVDDGGRRARRGRGEPPGPGICRAAAPSTAGAPAAPPAASDGSAAMILDLVPIWTVILGLAVFFYVVLDGFDLGVGILSGFAPTGVAPADDELDRADLGRQRDLAGARRHRAAGGVSARLRDHHSGRVFPDPRDAAGAGVPRRRVRVPLQAARACRRSGAWPSASARRWRRSRKASCSAPSSRASRSTAATSPAARSISSRRSRS